MLIETRLLGTLFAKSFGKKQHEATRSFTVRTRNCSWLSACALIHKLQIYCACQCFESTRILREKEYEFWTKSYIMDMLPTQKNSWLSAFAIFHKLQTYRGCQCFGATRILRGKNIFWFLNEILHRWHQRNSKSLLCCCTSVKCNFSTCMVLVITWMEMWPRGRKKIIRAAARFSYKEQHAKVRVSLQRKPHCSCYCPCTSVPENLDTVPYIYISLISMWSHVMIVTQEMSPRAVRCSCPLQDCNISVASIWRVWCLICRVVFKPCTWMPLGVLDLDASMMNDERWMHGWTKMDDGWRMTEDGWGYQIRMGMMMRMDQDGWCMKCRCIIDVWMCHVGSPGKAASVPRWVSQSSSPCRRCDTSRALRCRASSFAAWLRRCAVPKAWRCSPGKSRSTPVMAQRSRSQWFFCDMLAYLNISVQRKKDDPVFLSTVF